MYPNNMLKDFTRNGKKIYSKSIGFSNTFSNFNKNEKAEWKTRKTFPSLTKFFARLKIEWKTFSVIIFDLSCKFYLNSKDFYSFSAQAEEKSWVFCSLFECQKQKCIISVWMKFCDSCMVFSQFKESKSSAKI